MKNDFGLLFFRVCTGLMMMFPHGWGKLVSFGQKMNTFPDPIGIGSQASLALVVFAEFFCAMLIVIGVKTRWFAIPVAGTMLVAAFIIHGSDPWMKKELAVLFGVCFSTLVITGGGKYTIKD